MEVGHQICRETSPERGKMCVQTRVMKPTFKKVEVVYYLSRNGHLQHPHYIEVTHLIHQQLRLKDVLDRLTVVRGKGMPLVYSWSCKRSFKNGYVWNDLAINDVIFPSQSGEYVLKGSELVADCTEKLHQLQVGNDHPFQDGFDFYPKRRHSVSKPPRNGDECTEKEMHTTCSRGVSTDEIEEEDTHKHSELNLGHNSPSSPPSTASSTLSDRTSSSKRFEDGDAIENEPMLSRNSMLFNLIACGGSGSFRKTVLPPSVVAGRKSCSGGNLHKDRLMINYMSENPRFGNLQGEEKEYFSGSIAEQIIKDDGRMDVNHPTLKKSSSYNQERSGKAGLGEEEEVVEMKEKGLRGKCIPRRRKSSCKEGKKGALV